MDSLNETSASPDLDPLASPDPDQQSESNAIMDVLLKAFVGLLFALGFVEGFFMICSVFTSSNLNKKVSTKFSANILTSTVLSCLNATAFMIWEPFVNAQSKDRLLRALEYQFYISYTFGVVHHYSSCVLSLTRLTAMMWPVKYRALEIHGKATNFAVIMVWIYSILVTIPIYFGIFGIFDYENLSLMPYPEDTVGHKIGVVFYGILICVAPVWIEGIAYAIMYSKMSKARAASAKKSSDKSRHIISQWQSGVTRALLASIIVTTVCNTPYTVCTITNSLSGIRMKVFIPLVLHALQYPLLSAMFYIFAKDYRDAANQLFNRMLCNLPQKCFLKN